MSRSGYSDECDGPELNLWRGAVNQAIKGKRGQAFLREALAALEAMPNKRLTTDSLHEPTSGEFCTLGVVGASRGIDLKALEHESPVQIAIAFGISRALAAEIMFENDEEWCYPSTPEQRWERMHNWIKNEIKGATP